MHSVYLLRDNETVAGEQDIVRDQGLVKRTHSKGILMPDTWWDGQGVWGPWSKTWSFISRGPACPLNVTLNYDQAKGLGILRWKANSVGRPPAKYRVYFDIEKPVFRIEQGPPWLKIDEAIGMLSDIPDAPGQAEVAVSATIDHAVRNLDEKALSWGLEKVLSTTSERVGIATQKFVLVAQ